MKSLWLRCTSAVGLCVCTKLMVLFCFQPMHQKIHFNADNFHQRTPGKTETAATRHIFPISMKKMDNLFDFYFIH